MPLFANLHKGSQDIHLFSYTTTVSKSHWSEGANTFAVIAAQTIVLAAVLSTHQMQKKI